MIPTDNGELINRVIQLEEANEKLEKQARKSICQSCVSITSESDAQEYKIEVLETQLYRVQTTLNKVLAADYRGQIMSKDSENDCLRRSLESARGDTKELQKFIKDLGQAKVYADLFKKEAI